MSKAEKLEAFRTRLAKKANIDRFEEDLTNNIIRIMYYMKWDLDYVMELPPWTFNRIGKELNKIIEAENSVATTNMPKTIG